MREETARLAAGLVLVLLVTSTLEGVVAASVAISVELSDGDTCETGGTAYVRPAATPENARLLSENLAGCILGGETGEPAVGGPPGENDTRVPSLDGALLEPRIDHRSLVRRLPPAGVLDRGRPTAVYLFRRVPLDPW